MLVATTCCQGLSSGAAFGEEFRRVAGLGLRLLELDFTGI